MVRVKMLQSTYSTNDGYKVELMEEGKEYDVNSYHAGMLLKYNKAEFVQQYSTQSF